MRYGNQRNATGYDNPKDFFLALWRCAASGQGYRIAYTGPADIELFEDVCCAVWEVLDGRHLTHFVVEEFGRCCEGPGLINARRHPHHKQCWEQGRKYGLVLSPTSQRPQTISKDALENAGIIWAGNMGTRAAKSVAEEMDLTADDLRRTVPGEFWRWELGGGAAQKIKVFTPSSATETTKRQPKSATKPTESRLPV